MKLLLPFPCCFATTVISACALLMVCAAAPASTCPYLTRELHEPPPPLRFRSDDPPTTTTCFNLIDLFTTSEEILFATCTLYSGTGIDKQPSTVLLSKQRIALTIDNPFLYCPVPPTSMPSVDLLVVDVKNNWYSSSYEHYLLSGMNNQLEELLFHPKQHPIKFNLGSGITLLSAAAGWINFDGMSSNTKAAMAAPTVQDWATTDFQTSFYDTHTTTNETRQKYHLIRWDAKANLSWMPSNSVDVININCMLYYLLGHRGLSSVQTLIQEIYRVLKPGTGILRIGERDPTAQHLRPTIVEILGQVFGKQSWRNVGPLRTYTNSSEAMHVTSPLCVDCISTFLQQKQHKQANKAANTTVKLNSYGENDPRRKFQESMLEQGCWVCHIDMLSIPAQEQFIRQCEATHFMEDGCESVGRWYSVPVQFDPFFAVEAIKSNEEEDNKMIWPTVMDLSSQWPWPSVVEGRVKE